MPVRGGGGMNWSQLQEKKGGLALVPTPVWSGRYGSRG
jgi:hypothetical protein